MGTVLYCGLLVRHTGGTITVVLGLLFTLPILASLATDPSWREWIMRLSPMTAGLAIQSTMNLNLPPIAPWEGLGLLAAYTAVTMVAGRRAVPEKRRPDHIVHNLIVGYR